CPSVSVGSPAPRVDAGLAHGRSAVARRSVRACLHAPSRPDPPTAPTAGARRPHQFGRRLPTRPHPESIDAWHFERSARSALTEAAPTHDLGALRRLEAAASQWDGAPFPGVELPDTVTWQSELADLYTR